MEYRAEKTDCMDGTVFMLVIPRAEVIIQMVRIMTMVAAKKTHGFVFLMIFFRLIIKVIAYVNITIYLC